MKSIFAYAALLCCSAITLFAGDEIVARNAKLEDSKAIKALVADLKKPAVWLFVGDSITHGCQHTACHRNFVEHFAEMIKWEHTRLGARKGDIIINAGVSGETASGFIGASDFRLKAFNPSVVFIKFGVNDVRKVKNLDQFKTDMTKIIKMSRKKGAIPVLQVPNLVRNPMPDEEKYHQAIRDLADEQKCLLVDHAARWNEKEDARKVWLNDNLHPNEPGHLIMAETIVRSLDIAPEKSPTLNLSEQAK